MLWAPPAKTAVHGTVRGTHHLKGSSTYIVIVFQGGDDGRGYRNMYKIRGELELCPLMYLYILIYICAIAIERTPSLPLPTVQ
jgi:hypothetical protein